jgi:drug/metabolite transporter (DMT)-like permease
MKSGKIFALIVVLCPLSGIANTCIHYLNTGRLSISLFTVLFIILAVNLWRNKQRAYRNFRRLLWFFFAATIFLGFFSFMDFTNFHRSWLPLTIVEVRLVLIFTLVCTGAILYYSETDKVLEDFQIEKPVKKTVEE